MREAKITRAKNGYIVQYTYDVPMYLKIYRSWPEAMEAVSRFFALGDDEKPKKDEALQRLKRSDEIIQRWGL